MATMTRTTRAKLSIKNKYYIDKHRYYELKHFCLQYHIWKCAYAETDGLKGQSFGHDVLYNTGAINDPTPRLAEERLSYFNRMAMIEQTAIKTDPELAGYIIKAVTEGLSFNYLKTRMDIPCGKDLYYDRYRRFFWLLDKSRD